MEIIIINGVRCTVTHRTAEQYRRECEEIAAEKRRPEEMRRLVRAWLLDGDEMASSIWSDLWKDEYGWRPQYTEEEIRRMYGL